MFLHSSILLEYVYFGGIKPVWTQSNDIIMKAATQITTDCKWRRINTK